MKVVWKGFGRSIKMKENFADLIFQNFCSKRLKIDRFCVQLCSGIFPVSDATLAHTTGKNSMRYAFWRVPHTQRPLEACEPAPFTPKTRRLWGKDSIAVQLFFPGQATHARVNRLKKACSLPKIASRDLGLVHSHLWTGTQPPLDRYTIVYRGQAGADPCRSGVGVTEKSERTPIHNHRKKVVTVLTHFQWLKLI